jgi:hypothetical protein
LIEKPIQTEWLLQGRELLTVNIPDVNSIAGDKMTAFAANWRSEAVLSPDLYLIRHITFKSGIQRILIPTTP